MISPQGEDKLLDTYIQKMKKNFKPVKGNIIVSI